MVKCYSLKLQVLSAEHTRCRRRGTAPSAARASRLVTLCIYNSRPRPRGSTGALAYTNKGCHRPTAGCLRAARHEMDVPGPYYAGENGLIVKLIYEGEHEEAEVQKINQLKTNRRRTAKRRPGDAQNVKLRFKSRRWTRGFDQEGLTRMF